MRKYFICSVGEPGKDYVEDNLNRIINDSTFFMHEDTTRKGLYNSIKPGDVLILKYNSNYIAYGEAIGNKVIDHKNGWSLTCPVKKWYFFDESNHKRGVNSYGVQWETIPGSGQMGTVKGVTSGFGFQKIEKISNDNDLYRSLFNETKIGKMKNHINLLTYKKQIILQGPPGTGKTRLAEIIAKELTKEKKEINYYDDIIKFFTRTEFSDKEINFRNAGFELYSAFQENFEREKLENLNIDDYIVGKGDTDTFCYWLEFKLKDLGTYSGYSTKFKLFWNDSDQQYGKVGFIKEDSEEVAISKIKEVLLDIYDQENLELASKRMSDAFVLKVLNSYYPDKYFPILKKGFIDKSLQLLKVNYENNSTIFQRNKLLQQEFLNLKTKYNSEVSNFEFMHFLFKEFGLQDDLKIENEKITAEGEYKIILFHPNYSYEDFIRGIAATVQGNQIKYSVQNKILVDFIEKAITNNKKDANYVLIIDEINRANLSAVLGELIYALEYRDKIITGLYNFEGGDENHLKNNDLMLPSNLYIIGTMNTADRSVGHIDYAIRRRFAFVDVLPENLKVEQGMEEFDGILFEKVADLFKHITGDFEVKDVQLGHSYFIDKSGEPDGVDMKVRWQYEIKPILLEYIKDGILKESAKSDIEAIDNSYA